MGTVLGSMGTVLCFLLRKQRTVPMLPDEDDLLGRKGLAAAAGSLYTPALWVWDSQKCQNAGSKTYLTVLWYNEINISGYCLVITRKKC